MVHTTIVPGDSDSRGVDSTLLESCFGMAWREVRRTRSSAAAAAAIDQKAENKETTTVLTIVYSDGTNQTCLAANSRRASFDCVSCV
jgi:hypothetical protein